MNTEQTKETAEATQLPSSPDKLTFVAEYPGIASSLVFRYWTEPDLLTLWWPQQAEVDPREGGEYYLAWPGMAWHLRGTYLVFMQGERLSFTWHWDHESDVPMRYVDIRFEPLEEDGTKLTLTHHRYTEADLEERQGHIDGWVHFLSRLRDITGSR